MFKLDPMFQAEATKLSSASAYTRYADDIAFSCNIKGACNTFVERIESILEGTQSPKLLINKTKTFYTSRKGRRVITGIYITPDHKISIGRNRKKFVKGMIFRFKSNSLTPKQIRFLSGMLAFLMDIEPDYYNRLIIKYGAETFESLKKLR